MFLSRASGVPFRKVGRVSYQPDGGIQTYCPRTARVMTECNCSQAASLE